MKALITLLVVGVALPAWAQGKDQLQDGTPNKTQDAAQEISDVMPSTAPRGTSITLTGNLPESTVFWLIRERPPATPHEPHDCKGNPPDPRNRTKLVAGPPRTTNNLTTFTVLVPASLPLGEYSLCASNAVSAGNKTGMDWYTVPVLGATGRLLVVEPAGAAVPQITNVPRVVYEQAGRFKFSLIGSGFSAAGSDNHVLFNGNDVPLCWSDDPDCADKPTKGTARANSTHQLDLDLPSTFKNLYTGSNTVRVRVGERESPSDNPPSLTLAHISKGGPAWIASVVVALLAIIVVLLLGFNLSTHTIAGMRLSLLSSLLLDKGTDTYSLSRAQFYAWTGAAVFGYAYLTVAWALLQGRLEFPPVPGALPGIILASAGTATIVERIAASKPKGAGSIQPSLGDFISTGGMVVPERLQFLVWTLVGVATFVALILASDPATITTLPPIPREFLELMGVSSAGYLAGRMARKGGPVIDSILAKASSLTLELHGRYLSKSASFQIDDEDVALDQIMVGSTGERLPEVVTKDESAQDASMAKVLKLSLTSPKLNWMTRATHPVDTKRTHRLTIINPDGQKADWQFTLSGPTATVKVGDQLLESGATLQVKAGDQVAFDASGSKAESGTPDFNWTKDGNAQATTTAQYTDAFTEGTHTVVLTITDAQKATDMLTLKIEAK